MSIHIKKRIAVKILVYTLAAIFIQLFSSSLLPAAGLKNAPYLFVAEISLLALFEGISYATVGSVLIGFLFSAVSEENVAVNVLFCCAYSFFVILMLGSTFAKNFFSWLMYTLAGLALYEAVKITATAALWGVSLSSTPIYHGFLHLVLSLAMSSLLYPIYKKLSKITDIKS